MLQFDEFEVLEVNEPEDKIIVKITISPALLVVNNEFVDSVRKLIVGSDVVLGRQLPTVGKVVYIEHHDDHVIMQLQLVANIEKPEPATLNEWVGEIHDYAKSKGWWDNPRSPLEIHMLCVSELAEASEAVRNKEPAFHRGLIGTKDSGFYLTEDNLEKDPVLKQAHGNDKPEGEATELADAVIRIFDYFGHKGWDLEAIIKAKHAYNKTRPYRHGGKAL